LNQKAAWLPQPHIRIPFAPDAAGHALNGATEVRAMAVQPEPVERDHALWVASEPFAVDILLDEHERRLARLHGEAVFEEDVRGASERAGRTARNHRDEAVASHHHRFEVRNREHVRFRVDGEEVAGFAEEIPEEGVHFAIFGAVAVAEVRRNLSRHSDGHPI
jgi:hypothetical protein